ncbi:MAG: fatty acid desaturase [Cytophagales bacterium]
MNVETLEKPNQEKPFLKGRELILQSMKYAKEDKFRSWLETLMTLVLMALAFSGTFFINQWLGKLVFSVLAGLLIVRFFIIYHDFLHGAILKKSPMAKLIMTLFGIFVLAPINIWKGTHDHHHNNNSKLSNHGIGSYPLLSKNDFERLSKKKKFIYLATRHPLTIFFGYFTLFIFDFNIRSIINNPRKHWDSFIALVLHIGIATFIFISGGFQTLILSWIIPFIIANALGAYLFYAQHNFPGATFKDNRNWDYAQAAIDSTSYMKMGPLMNWMTGNIGYHHVHHVNHTIPFYRLKEAMRNMPELQNPKTTSLHPKDIIACLRLKIWDPELGEIRAL